MKAHPNISLPIKFSLQWDVQKAFVNLIIHWTLMVRVPMNLSYLAIIHAFVLIKIKGPCLKVSTNAFLAIHVNLAVMGVSAHFS